MQESGGGTLEALQEQIDDIKHIDKCPIQFIRKRCSGSSGTILTAKEVTKIKNEYDNSTDTCTILFADIVFTDPQYSIGNPYVNLKFPNGSGTTGYDSLESIISSVLISDSTYVENGIVTIYRNGTAINGLLLEMSGGALVYSNNGGSSFDFKMIYGSYVE